MSMSHLHLIYKPAKKIWTAVKIRTRKLLQLLKHHPRTLKEPKSHFCLHTESNKSFLPPEKTTLPRLKTKSRGSVGIITFFNNVNYIRMIQNAEINTDYDIAGIQMSVAYKCEKYQQVCICIIKSKVFIMQKGTDVIMMDRQRLI